MNSSDYDLLLLDFGGVCLLNPVEMHSIAEEKLGLLPGTFTWFGPVDPSTDPLWQELTSGAELREREYWARRAADVGRAAGIELDLPAYMQLLYTPPSNDLIRPACTDVVDRSFAAGLSVSVLTNDLRAFHGRDWEQGIDVLQRVEHIVDCSDTGILKPDPRAFARACEITGFDVGRILFVDDQRLSVAGAEAIGIDALWFDISEPEASWAGVATALGI